MKLTKLKKKKIASFIPIQPNSTSTQPLLSKLIFFFKKRFEEYYEKEEEESKEFAAKDQMKEREQPREAMVTGV